MSMASILRTKSSEAEGSNSHREEAWRHAAQNGNKEAVARAVIEERLGRSLDDDTWQRMRQRLIEFVVTLKRWNEQEKSASAEAKSNAAN